MEQDDARLNGEEVGESAAPMAGYWRTSAGSPKSELHCRSIETDSLICFLP